MGMSLSIQYEAEDTSAALERTDERELATDAAVLVSESAHFNLKLWSKLGDERQG